MNSSLKYKSYAHIDLDALVHNYNSLVACAKEKSPDARPICVVKADAYGHGARECVRALCRAGADFFAVSDVSEALDVREATAESKIQLNTLLCLGAFAQQNVLRFIHVAPCITFSFYFFRLLFYSFHSMNRMLFFY